MLIYRLPEVAAIKSQSITETVVLTIFRLSILVAVVLREFFVISSCRNKLSDVITLNSSESPPAVLQSNAVGDKLKIKKTNIGSSY